MTIYKENDSGIKAIWQESYNDGQEDESYELWWELTDGDIELYCQSGHHDYIDNIHGLLEEQFELELNEDE